jgi:hypothetical protein
MQVDWRRCERVSPVIGNHGKILRPELFKKAGFKIQTLGTACSLFVINQKRLLQELEKAQR